MTLCDLGKIAVPPQAHFETARTGHAIRDQRLAAIVPFLNERIPYRKSMASYR